MLKTHWRFWRPAWPALFGLIACTLKTRLYLIKSLLRLGGRLVGGSLFGGKGGTHGFAEFMLTMEYVRRVMGSEMMFDLGQKSRGFITGGLNHLTVQLSQCGCHEFMPDVLIAGLRELFQEDAVADGLGGHQA